MITEREYERRLEAALAATSRDHLEQAIRSVYYFRQEFYNDDGRHPMFAMFDEGYNQALYHLNQVLDGALKIEGSAPQEII